MSTSRPAISLMSKFVRAQIREAGQEYFASAVQDKAEDISGVKISTAPPMSVGGLFGAVAYKMMPSWEPQAVGARDAWAKRQEEDMNPDWSKVKPFRHDDDVSPVVRQTGSQAGATYLNNNKPYNEACYAMKQHGSSINPAVSDFAHSTANAVKSGTIKGE